MELAAANELLAFWFSDEAKKRWFNSTVGFDDLLRERYQALYSSAKNGELDDWKQTPEGALALVILFDQIPLNIYRGKPQSFATEQRARDVAQHAIDHGLDRSLADSHKVFLYMPFMHSENIDDQNKAVELFEQAGLKENLRFAKHHRQIIEKFGRFPHRNNILGRSSTTDEIDYLDSPVGFHG